MKKSKDYTKKKLISIKSNIHGKKLKRRVEKTVQISRRYPDGSRAVSLIETYSKEYRVEFHGRTIDQNGKLKPGKIDKHI